MTSTFAGGSITPGRGLRCKASNASNTCNGSNGQSRHHVEAQLVGAALHWLVMTHQHRGEHMTEQTLAGVIPASRLEQSPDGSHMPRQGPRLSDTQRMLIEQRIANDKPSTGAAYVLCLFLGAFGIHRFYLGRTGSAIAMLILGITVLGLLITGVWAIIDLFLIPSIVREKVEALRQRYTLEALAHAG